MKMDGKRDEEDGGAKPAKSLEDELGLDNLTERVGTQQRLLGRLRQLFAEGQYRDMDLEPPPEDAWYLTIYYFNFYFLCYLYLYTLITFAGYTHLFIHYLFGAGTTHGCTGSSYGSDHGGWRCCCPSWWSGCRGPRP